MARRKYKNKFTGPHVDSVLRRTNIDYGYAVVSKCPNCNQLHTEHLKSFSNVHHSRNCSHCNFRFYSVLNNQAKDDKETQQILKEMGRIFEAKKRRNIVRR